MAEAVVGLVVYSLVVLVGLRWVVAPWCESQWPLAWRDGESRGFALFMSMTLLWLPATVFTLVGKLVIDGWKRRG